MKALGPSLVIFVTTHVYNLCIKRWLYLSQSLLALDICHKAHMRQASLLWISLIRKVIACKFVGARKGKGLPISCAL